VRLLSIIGNTVSTTDVVISLYSKNQHFLLLPAEH